MFTLTENQKETMDRENIDQVLSLSGSSVVVGSCSTMAEGGDISYFIHLDECTEPTYMSDKEAKLLAYSLLNMVGD